MDDPGELWERDVRMVFVLLHGRSEQVASTISVVAFAFFEL